MMRVGYKSICLFLAFIGVNILPTTISSDPPRSGSHEVFLGRYKIPYETPQSIDIDTTRITNIGLEPLVIVGATNDRVRVINTGRAVEVYLDQPTIFSRITGGPLFTDSYRFYKIRFYWTDDPTGDAGTTINGQGTQLEAVPIFYNEKYGSFENAIKFRDGVAKIIFRIQIGSVPNPLFTPFGNQLRRIPNPGSEVELNLGQATQWYYFPFESPNARYFAYPGSYTDLTTERMYYCSTTIVYSVPFIASISRNQFTETFGALKNILRGPLVNRAPRHPRLVPVVQAVGVNQYRVPASK